MPHKFFVLAVDKEQLEVYSCIQVNEQELTSLYPELLPFLKIRYIIPESRPLFLHRYDCAPMFRGIPFSPEFQDFVKKVENKNSYVLYAHGDEEPSIQKESLIKYKESAEEQMLLVFDCKSYFNRKTNPLINPAPR